MGYTTDFTGEFELNKQLSKEHFAYLKAFADSRRMKRDPEIAKKIPDPIRMRAGLPVGEEGEFCVGGDGYKGQDADSSIIDYNAPPSSQPSLWCNWEPNDNGSAIEWNGAEKFYSYVEWLRYIVVSFLVPWGYTLNGQVRWRGEDFDDIGTITVKDNVITARAGAWEGEGCKTGWWTLTYEGVDGLSEADLEHIGYKIMDGFTSGQIVQESDE